MFLIGEALEDAELVYLNTCIGTGWGGFAPGMKKKLPGDKAGPMPKISVLPMGLKFVSLSSTPNTKEANDSLMRAF